MRQPLLQQPQRAAQIRGGRRRRHSPGPLQPLLGGSRECSACAGASPVRASASSTAARSRDTSSPSTGSSRSSGAASSTRKLLLGHGELPQRGVHRGQVRREAQHVPAGHLGQRGDGLAQVGLGLFEHTQRQVGTPQLPARACLQDAAAKLAADRDCRLQVLRCLGGPALLQQQTPDVQPGGGVAGSGPPPAWTCSAPPPAAPPPPSSAPARQWRRRS